MDGRAPPIVIPEPAVTHPREEVGSSSVSHVGYDAETETLYLTFRKTGMTFLYLDVPEAEYEAVMTAPSLGAYVNRAIKPNFVCIPEP